MNPTPLASGDSLRRRRRSVSTSSSISVSFDELSESDNKSPRKRIKIANASGAAGTRTALPKKRVILKKTGVSSGNNISGKDKTQMSTAAPAPPGPGERGEREIECVPCLKSLVKGNGDGICKNGPADRCVGCAPGIYAGLCVPIPAVVRDLARDLRTATKRRYRDDISVGEASGLDKKLKELRTAIQMVLERSDVITATVISDAFATEVVSKPVHTLAAPAAPAVPAIPVAPSTVHASVQKEEHKNVVQAVLPGVPASPVQPVVPQGFADYNERRDRFLDAVEPLVNSVFIPAVSRFLDRYFK
ncbi:uncharacterized protein CTRU02_207252 [Colletotrichum truncatum]|uniref:Uncharacterized protein n=1 Tax=Colletotrichum truncatum TaxID=5467 RepID=A0ACC3Z0B7_COLTU|nr:uncharacterized protein CTRU02_01114 [Colletotrichum truncatum]KAF6800709.1 hypothetical protein CTRU02_01114 [Colletotrichum truncatum]